MIEMSKEVNKIVNYLENYQNKDNLSWINVYKTALKELSIDSKGKDNLLLSNTVKEITIRGYDIISDPFRLERFR